MPMVGKLAAEIFESCVKGSGEHTIETSHGGAYYIERPTDGRNPDSALIKFAGSEVRYFKISYNTVNAEVDEVYFKAKLLEYIKQVDLKYKIENYNLEEGLIEANSAKREIDKLGYVNVNAIEESVVLKERFENLNEQMLDLTKAEEDTSKVIRELNSEMVNRFTNEFAKINENFKKVFKELFGGGSAELILVKPETEDEQTGEKVCDILEAGVDIIAQPPGKALKNLSLLSGGEKALTAIAILFSILKLKPMPFCLLDEIEAALDDANVGRFAKYLNRFSSETQFIVITHRKPTMELADRLYGVTMQEKGVSKIVSVKLSDVDYE